MSSIWVIYVSNILHGYEHLIPVMIHSSIPESLTYHSLPHSYSGHEIILDSMVNSFCGAPKPIVGPLLILKQPPQYPSSVTHSGCFVCSFTGLQTVWQIQFYRSSRPHIHVAQFQLWPHHCTTILGFAISALDVPTTVIVLLF